MDAFGCPDAVLWFDSPDKTPQELAVLLLDRIIGRASAESGHPQALNLERQIDAYRLCRARFTDMSRRWCAFRNLNPTQNVVVDCMGDLKAVCAQVAAVMRSLGME